MKNPLYQTMTYMGSFDDMVSLFPPVRKYQEGCYHFSSILCEQLLFSGPMLINDGYLVQQPEFLQLCAKRPAYLDAAVQSGTLKILSRAESLNQVIENSARTGVLGHKRYRNGEYKKYQKQIELLSDYFHQHNAIVPFPQKDLTDGYLQLSEKAADLLETDGCIYPNRDVILPLVVKAIQQIKKEGQAARTQWEQVSADLRGYSIRSEQALDDEVNRSSMHLANEIYHHNLSMLVAHEVGMPIFCDTNRSGLFDDLIDQKYGSFKKMRNQYIPYVSKKHLLQNSDNLAGLFDQDNILYSIKREYLKELYLFMTDPSKEDGDLLEIKEIYQSALSIKLGYKEKMSQYFHRLNMAFSLGSGVASSLLGAVIAPQIGFSMIMATVALAAASYVGGNYAVPRGLSLFFSQQIDQGKALDLKFHSKQYARNASFMNLPISLEQSSQFAQNVKNFSD